MQVRPIDQFRAPGLLGLAKCLCHWAVSSSRDCIEKKTCGAAEENRFFEPNTVILEKSVF